MMNNNITLAANNDFMVKLPAENVTTLGNGMVRFTTNKSFHFNPLVLQKKDDQIFVTREDYLSEDQLIELFGENPVMQYAQYSFDEAAIMALLGDEAEYLCDIVAFLEDHNFVESEKLIELITALVKEGFGVCNVILVLNSMSNSELARLFIIYDEMSVDLRRNFAELV